MKERLQKHLARAGLGSRRYCESLIEQGRVAVNGILVDRVGYQVDPAKDEIAVDGEPIRGESLVYYILHKPRGFVCSSRPQGDSRSALELVRARHGERLFCVGRLDEQSQGALLLTNDGEFCNRIIHPRYGVEKTYLVCVKGKPEIAMLDKVRRGIHLAEGKTAPARVHVVKRSRSHSLVKVSLHEGKNRHLRRIFARIGLPVTEIVRLQIGSVSLGHLKPGQYRDLKPAEIEALLEESRQHERGELDRAAAPDTALDEDLATRHLPLRDEGGDEPAADGRSRPAVPRRGAPRPAPTGRPFGAHRNVRGAFGRNSTTGANGPTKSTGPNRTGQTDRTGRPDRSDRSDRSSQSNGARGLRGKPGARDGSAERRNGSQRRAETPGSKSHARPGSRPSGSRPTGARPTDGARGPKRPFPKPRGGAPRSGPPRGKPRGLPGGGGAAPQDRTNFPADDGDDAPFRGFDPESDE